MLPDRLVIGFTYEQFRINRELLFATCDLIGDYSLAVEQAIGRTGSRGIGLVPSI